MDTKEYNILVLKNLKGELSSAEFDHLNKLTAANSKLSALRIELETAWDKSGKEANLVTKEETQAILTKLNNTVHTPIASKVKSKTIQLRRIISIAAMFILVMSVMLLIKDKVVIHNQAGEYILADNSVVTLRENSQLEVSKFDESSRNVKLKGEAYFNISKDKNRPFKVISDQMTIEVLGTEFLVKEMGAETIIKLDEGKIKTKNIQSKQSEILVAGMTVKHNANGEIVIFKKVNNLSSWNNGTYQYNKVKLGDVLAELSLIHNTVINAEPALLNCEVNGIIIGKNIENLLSRIAQKYNMSIKKDGLNWKLHGGKCN